jgi:glycosyltransferase involved in cell wall biosynthesis
LELFVVLPCYNESHITTAIDSLSACFPPTYPVQLIIVVNSEQNCSENVLNQNKKSLLELAEWDKSKPNWIKLHTLALTDVPHKVAGVGNARKHGMDYASTLAQNAKKSIIICYDADCRCSTNYLQSIETAFDSNPTHEVATIYFEHDAKDNDAIIDYELFLRYHYQSLKSTGYPYAYQTIGSSMAVRADTYTSFGGMNQRKAGEDFYFLHKVIPYRNVLEINNCAVYPSARSSDRVPFGTGHAVAKFYSSKCPTYYTYHPSIYKEITSLIDAFETATIIEGVNTLKVSKDIRNFLTQTKFEKALVNFLKQQKTNDALRQSLFRWLNGFRMLKLVHHLRDQSFTNITINEAVRIFWKKYNNEDLNLTNHDWLLRFRNLEKR